MTSVVPTVLATTPEEYAIRVARAESLSPRVHVDIADGRFTDATTIGLAQVQVAEGTDLDLHLMLQDPGAASKPGWGFYRRLRWQPLRP